MGGIDEAKAKAKVEAEGAAPRACGRTEQLHGRSSHDMSLLRGRSAFSARNPEVISNL